MEIESSQNILQVYSPTELDRDESETIEALKRRSQQPMLDPDQWLEEANSFPLSRQMPAQADGDGGFARRCLRRDYK